MDRNEIFERCFVAVVDRILNERNITAVDLSVRVWGGHMVKPDNAWQGLKDKADGTKKPRSLKLWEAHGIAVALGYDLDYLIDRASKELKKIENK
jgi:hypothetical protein